MKTKYDTTMELIKREKHNFKHGFTDTDLVKTNMMMDIAESLAIIADGIQALVNEKVTES